MFKFQFLPNTRTFIIIKVIFIVVVLLLIILMFKKEIKKLFKKIREVD